MFANQVKGITVVIEIRAESFDAIMTGHAVRPEGQDVLGGKGLVHLEVAVRAHGLIKGHGIIFHMAVTTGKSGAVGLALMGA